MPQLWTLLPLKATLILSIFYWKRMQAWPELQEIMTKQLRSAARMGHVEVVTSLLNKDPQIGFRTDKKGQTALHMASKGQNAEILLELLKPDVSVIHLEDNKGNKPLHVAARKGSTIIYYLSNCGIHMLVFLSEGIDICRDQ